MYIIGKRPRRKRKMARFEIKMGSMKNGKISKKLVFDLAKAVAEVA